MAAITVTLIKDGESKSVLAYDGITTREFVEEFAGIDYPSVSVSVNGESVDGSFELDSGDEVAVNKKNNKSGFEE